MSIVRESTVRLHKTTWTLGLSTEDVTEDKVWGFLFYQAHQDKRKQGGNLKAGMTRKSTSNVDTKDCATLISIIPMGATELGENLNISQFIGCSQLNQYLCACLKLLKKKKDAGQNVIYTYMVKYERVFMLTKMVKSRKLKYANSTYK